MISLPCSVELGWMWRRAGKLGVHKIAKKKLDIPPWQGPSLSEVIRLSLSERVQYCAALLCQWRHQISDALLRGGNRGGIQLLSISLATEISTTKLSLFP